MQFRPMVDKKELSREFSQQWEKHYKIEALTKRGYKRQQCSSCKRFFWSLAERDVCGDPSCIGYEFIGNSPSKKRLSYVETWKVLEKYFVDNGHTSITPYPTVARWRDDLYFTIASINDFQPYVVNGELDPIANPLIVPQPCIRFSDISNVGVTGRHYTNFVMVGQHAFNNERTGLFYWKEDAIEHDINYLKALGIPEEELIFQEDVWAGGGNFGPSIEYFAGGLELGNCVFMQYEELADGTTRELNTKVIDMGAGLSRLCWITNGDPTSYELVLGKPVEILKKDFGIDIDKELFLKYAKLSGSLNVDEVDDIEKAKELVAKKLSTTKEELFNKLEPLQAIYAIADHTLTLLFTITDGMMPSNSGGGYNLRLLARRIFAFEDKYGFEMDYKKVLDAHMDHLTGLFDQYKKGVDVSARVIEEERKRYDETKNRAKSKVITLVKKAKNAKITKEDLLLLYKSNGIPPEYVRNIAKESGIDVEIPGNFYELVREPDSSRTEHKKLSIDVSHYGATEKLYYELSYLEDFKATVLGIEGNYVILDKTMFYPEGGGQAGDSGYLDGVRVSNTVKVGNVVLHEVSEPSKFKKGQEVIGVVDKERRYDITRNHTATHMITAAAKEVLGNHVWQAGAKKDEDKAHIDLTHYARITEEELAAIEMKANEWVMANKPINVFVLPRNKAEEKYGFTIYQGGAVPGKDIRIIEIEDIDAEACGGTHHLLQATGNIGYIKIVKRESVKDGVERLTFKAGRPAVRYVQERETLLKRSADVYKVPVQELPQTCERFFSEWKVFIKRAERAEEELLKELLSKSDIVEVSFEPQKVPQHSNTKVVLTPSFIYVVGDNAANVWEKLAPLNIKGGGSKKFFKGRRGDIKLEDLTPLLQDSG
ncbi:MAG: alanine--tRNA ligase [Methanobacteriota archaeon]|nr:MAG: alanine--tRNA ligase [Euryarchaeota archaeon]